MVLFISKVAAVNQVVNAKDAKDVVEGVIDAATAVFMDGAGGLVYWEAGLKNIVKTQADIKSSTSKKFVKINYKRNPLSKIANRSATQQNTPHPLLRSLITGGAHNKNQNTLTNVLIVHFCSQSAHRLKNFYFK